MCEYLLFLRLANRYHVLDVFDDIKKKPTEPLNLFGYHDDTQRSSLCLSVCLKRIDGHDTYGKIRMKCLYVDTTYNNQTYQLFILLPFITKWRLQKLLIELTKYLILSTA